MKLRPRFSYGPGPTVVNLSLPSRFWEYAEGANMGDEDKSAASIPVGYWVGWEYAIIFAIRFVDSEYAAVMTMLQWMLKNKSTAFTFRFDQDDATSEYSCYLEEPKLSERVTPKRDGTSPELFEQRMVLRSSNGTRFNYPIPYF